jgi:AraC-like DNA-binding protein
MRARRSAAPRDWERVSKSVAEAYFPHELTVPGGQTESRLVLETVDLGPALVGHVGWGADVQVECAYPGAYEINVPLTGHLVSRGRHGSITSVPGQATVFRADTLSRITHWDATCTVLGVKFDSTWLDREAEHVLGTGLGRASAVVPEQLDLQSGSARSWRQLVGGLASHLREPDLFVGLPVVQEQLAGALSAGFLLAAYPHAGRGPAARPRAVARVVDAVRADPSRAWTVADMAALSGTGVRRLQEGFRDWMGCSPMEHLVDVRLQRARADLEGDRSLLIGEVAARWGFSSASRFAAAYQRRYGQAPSALRR